MLERLARLVCNLNNQSEIYAPRKTSGRFIGAYIYRANLIESRLGQVSGNLFMHRHNYTRARRCTLSHAHVCDFITSAR